MPSVSLALSKNQSLDVKVVSYLDMSLLFVLVLVSVTVLILFPRPFLRLRLRALGSGRRPTPDDLEPLTPLSRARKKLIARYMPKPDTGRGRPAGSSASRAVPRLPLPTPRPTVVPASGESVERPLRKLPSRSFETAVESLRRASAAAFRCSWATAAPASGGSWPGPGGGGPVGRAHRPDQRLHARADHVYAGDRNAGGAATAAAKGGPERRSRGSR